MDVAKKNVANIPRLGAEFGERARDVIEGRFRAGIEKDGAFIGLERGGSDNAGAIEMLSIEDVNHRVPLNLTQHRRTAKRQSSSLAIDQPVPLFWDDIVFLQASQTKVPLKLGA